MGIQFDNVVLESIRNIHTYKKSFITIDMSRSSDVRSGRQGHPLYCVESGENER